MNYRLLVRRFLTGLGVPLAACPPVSGHSAHARHGRTSRPWHPPFQGLLCAFTLMLAATAQARNADGTLGFLQRPNNGIPALLAGTVDFTVEAQGEATLEISGAGGTYPVTVAWSGTEGGLHHGA